MKENFILKNIKIFRLMSKDTLTNDDIFYLLKTHDNVEKVVEKVGIERIIALNEEQLKEILQLPNGKVLLENHCESFLELGKDILSYKITSIKKSVLDFILEKSLIINNSKYKYDIEFLFKNFSNGAYYSILGLSNDILFFEYDEVNHKIILNLIMKKYSNIPETIFNQFINNIQVAEWMACNGYLELLITAPEDILLHKMESLSNKTILEAILDKDTTLVSKISKFSLMNREIAEIVINKTKKTDQFIYKINKVEKHSIVNHEYIEENIWHSFDEQIILDSFSEELIREFRNVMQTGTKSDEEIINLVIMSFMSLISKNNSKGVKDLKNIIEIKKKYPDFHLKYDINNGSQYISDKKCVSVKNKYDINAFNHELAHMFHSIFDANRVPHEFANLLSKIFNNEDFNIKTLNFLKFMQERYDDIIKAKCENFINDKFNGDNLKKYVADLVEEFLSEKIDANFIIDLFNGDVSNDIIELIISADFDRNTINECILQLELKEIFTYKKQLYEKKYAGELEIENFLDAILGGKLLKLIETNQIEFFAPTHVHDEQYYKSINPFLEVIATYASIAKSSNGEYLISVLKELVGDELIDFLDNYYTNILTFDEGKIKA